MNEFGFHDNCMRKIDRAGRHLRDGPNQLSPSDEGIKGPKLSNRPEVTPPIGGRFTLDTALWLVQDCSFYLFRVCGLQVTSGWCSIFRYTGLRLGMLQTVVEATWWKGHWGYPDSSPLFTLYVQSITETHQFHLPRSSCISSLFSISNSSMMEDHSIWSTGIAKFLTDLFFWSILYMIYNTLQWLCVNPAMILHKSPVQTNPSIAPNDLGDRV